MDALHAHDPCCHIFREDVVPHSGTHCVMMYDSPLAVLVVDADRTGADCACHTLHAKASPSDSIRVLAASSIAEALATVTTESVDVVLLDTPLDDTSMLDAVRRLRRALPDLPIVVAADE